MSEEKKPTDEATIDSLKEMAIKFSENTYVNRVLVNAINLMQDLKAENESFGETINLSSETLRNQRAKIEQLKINLANEKKLGKIQTKQAVKDTANKILDDLRNIFIEQSSYGCDANQHIGYYDYEVKTGLVIEQIEEYAKEKYDIEYGVEVE